MKGKNNRVFFFCFYWKQFIQTKVSDLSSDLGMERSKCHGYAIDTERFDTITERFDSICRSILLDRHIVELLANDSVNANRIFCKWIHWGYTNWNQQSFPCNNSCNYCPTAIIKYNGPNFKCKLWCDCISRGSGHVVGWNNVAGGRHDSFMSSFQLFLRNCRL